MGYIYENIEKPQKTAVGATCDRCSKELKLVFDHHAQAKDASLVEVEGWYGGFYDPVWDVHKISMLLCEGCSEGLFEYLGKDRYGDDENGLGDH